MEISHTLDHFTDQIALTLPHVIGALLILLIGWLIAKGVKNLITRLLQRTNWDEKIFKNITGGKDTNAFVGSLFYYLIMIIVFLIVLETLGISAVLTPLEAMVGEFLLFIPHLLAALIIGFVGYLLAKFVSGLISFGGGFLTKWVDKTGFKDTDKVIKVLRTLVFLIIFVPLLIQAINALQLEAISDPLNSLLTGFIAMIGNIVLAAVVLIVFIWGGKYLARFLSGLFQNLGLDRMAEKLQLQNMIGPGQSFSRLIAQVLYFFILFFGGITATEILQLKELTLILYQILNVTGSIAFGLLILLIGNFISLLIYNGMIRSEKNAFIASVLRYATLALFLGMAFRAMGIANAIVELAFGLTLGAVAIVIALSYGLGGREAAGEHFREIIQKIKGPGNTAGGENRSSSSDLP